MTCWTSRSAFPKLSGSAIPCETAAPGAQPAASISPLPVHRPAHPTRPLLFLQYGLSSTTPRQSSPAPPTATGTASDPEIELLRDVAGEKGRNFGRWWSEEEKKRGGEVGGLWREYRRSSNLGSSVFPVFGHGPVVWSNGGPKSKQLTHPLPQTKEQINSKDVLCHINVVICLLYFLFSVIISGKVLRFI